MGGSPPLRLGISGSVVSSSGMVWGEAPAENVLVHCQIETTHNDGNKLFGVDPYSFLSDTVGSTCSVQDPGAASDYKDQELADAAA